MNLICLKPTLFPQLTLNESELFVCLFCFFLFERILSLQHSSQFLPVSSKCFLIWSYTQSLTFDSHSCECKLKHAGWLLVCSLPRCESVKIPETHPARCIFVGLNMCVCCPGHTLLTCLYSEISRLSLAGLFVWECLW